MYRYSRAVSILHTPRSPYKACDYNPLALRWIMWLRSIQASLCVLWTVCFVDTGPWIYLQIIVCVDDPRGGGYSLFHTNGNFAEESVGRDQINQKCWTSYVDTPLLFASFVAEFPPRHVWIGPMAQGCHTLSACRRRHSEKRLWHDMIHYLSNTFQQIAAIPAAPGTAIEKPDLACLSRWSAPSSVLWKNAPTTASRGAIYFSLTLRWEDWTVTLLSEVHFLCIEPVMAWWCRVYNGTLHISLSKSCNFMCRWSGKIPFRCPIFTSIWSNLHQAIAAVVEGSAVETIISWAWIFLRSWIDIPQNRINWRSRNWKLRQILE